MLYYVNKLLNARRTVLKHECNITTQSIGFLFSLSNYKPKVRLLLGTQFESVQKHQIGLVAFES